MKLHDLQPAPGAKHRKKRVGRGISAGQGKTAGRGTKGEGARRGTGGKLHRQGGNLPLFRKLPFKRGFTNLRKIYFVEVNLGRLNDLFEKNADVNPESLVQVGVMKDPKAQVAILGEGELTKVLNVKVHRVSAPAKAAIEKLGGKVELLPVTRKVKVR
jgi:large subunit ribosomal protein L15